jgi:LPS sulfotransferase NodH
MQKILDKIKNNLSFQANLLAIEFDWLDSHRDYSKFIVLGNGRSGSNFLLGLLNSHSQVITYGELFQATDRIDWGLYPYNRYLQSKRLISLMNEHPEKFLREIVFRKYLASISAVGFKLFYSHAKGDSRETVWQFLQERQDIKIIHLKRENFLKSWLSFKKALITNKWVVLSQQESGHKSDNVKVFLDYEGCLNYFNCMQNSMLEYDLFFEQHQKIDVIYEELCTDYPSVMRQIQEFLEIDQETLEPATVKQSSLSLSESITNYFELKEQFQNTIWSIFFED